MGLFNRLKDLVTTEVEDESLQTEEYALDDEEEIADEISESKINTNSGIAISSPSIELKVVKPERYDNVTQIADHLIAHRTVVLNLEATNKETARRIIDFLSGVAYSIGGQLKRVAANTFVITPQNVDVSGDQMRLSEQKQNVIHPETVVEMPSTDTIS
ncbi:MAG: cell division protein SepF [Clostridia bacterium]|nr:cell division protein SepF [Clostridia bacterium]